MAIFSGSILGKNVRKRIGNVTTYTLNGQCIVRSVPASFKDSKTPKQLKNRERMKRVFDLSISFEEAHEFGFPERKATHSTYNAFVSANSKHIEVDEQLQTSVDWAQLACSDGSLLAPKVSARRGATTNALVFTVQKVGDTEWRRGSDVVYAVLYDKCQDSLSVHLLGQRRCTASVSVKLDQKWAVENTEIYCFAVSKNGQMASKTVYLKLEEPTTGKVQSQLKIENDELNTTAPATPVEQATTVPNERRVENMNVPAGWPENGVDSEKFLYLYPQ